MKRILGKKMIIGIMMIIFFLPSFAQKKDFVYKKNPYLQNGAISDISYEIKNNAIDITKYLPADFVIDASIDYTAYLQKGLDENRIAIMPNFALLVNEKGINVKSGLRIIFQKKSSLIMKPNSLEGFYGIMNLFNVEDIRIYKPVLIGERNKHIGTKGEWGMGIFIKGAKNIQIINPIISDCWGDGIVFGKGNNGCRNIKIINAKIDNCRRNGISLCDGYNIEIRNPIISNTQGTLPMCGMDIEPDDNNATINNILIINPITFNNSTAGILIHLNNLLEQAKKKVGIRIENHLDDSSGAGFILGSYKEQNSPNQSLSGSIDIINPEWKNNITPFSVGNNSKGPMVNFKNLKMKNPTQNLQKIKQELSKIRNISVK